MYKKIILEGIETHVAGEPARVITGGMPEFLGKTVAEKKQFVKDNYDHLRTALMHEPRGSNAMFGSFVFSPVEKDASVGIIFMDTGSYLNMCGHNTIGAVTALVETGFVKTLKGEKSREVVLDTPAGLVQATAKLGADLEVNEVSFNNVKSFLYEQDVSMDIDGIGKITFDIAFGGSFFAILPASQVGVEIKGENSMKFSYLGTKIMKEINRRLKVQHPSLSHINTVDLVEFYGPPTKDSGADAKNVVVFGAGSIDRSPCGTGTSAKVAVLHAKGELPIGKEFVHESIIGTKFKAEVVEATRLGKYEAVVPKITGSAFITGFSKFVINESDPLKYGFLLGDML